MLNLSSKILLNLLVLFINPLIFEISNAQLSFSTALLMESSVYLFVSLFFFVVVAVINRMVNAVTKAGATWFSRKGRKLGRLRSCALAVLYRRELLCYLRAILSSNRFHPMRYSLHLSCYLSWQWPTTGNTFYPCLANNDVLWILKNKTKTKQNKKKQK